MAHLALGDDRPAAGHGREQVNRPPVGPDGAAQRLAFRRDRSRRLACRLVSASLQPRWPAVVYAMTDLFSIQH
jgi:hypothetical protein